jgi:hypothetical protein
MQNPHPQHQQVQQRRVVQTPNINVEMVQTLHSIDKRLKRLNALNLHYEFTRGLIHGLGLVIGSTLLIALTIVILRQFITVPVIGEWVVEIIEIVDRRRVN